MCRARTLAVRLLHWAQDHVFLSARFSDFLSDTLRFYNLSPVLALSLPDFEKPKNSRQVREGKQLNGLQ